MPEPEHAASGALEESEAEVAAAEAAAVLAKKREILAQKNARAKAAKATKQIDASA
jgi:hypothetical protein